MNAMRRFTLHQLHVFRAVARHRNFTQAAVELRLTQSAVSAQIRELTVILGVPLFDIIGRGVHLTEAGVLLEARAALIEGLVDEIGQNFMALHGAEIGRISIGASTSIGTYLLPEILAAFASVHPRIEVALEIQNSSLVEERILRNDFDLGFIGSRVTSAELITEPFREDEIFFAAAPTHPLTLKSKVSLDDLAGERIIVREPGSGTRRTMEDVLKDRGVRLKNVMQLGAIEAIKQAVIAGLGISWFSGLTVRHEIEEGRLAKIRVDGLSVTRTFLAIRHRKKKETPSIAAFLSFVRERRPA